MGLRLSPSFARRWLRPLADCGTAGVVRDPRLHRFEGVETWPCVPQRWGTGVERGEFTTIWFLRCLCFVLGIFRTYRWKGILSDSSRGIPTMSHGSNHSYYQRSFQATVWGGVIRTFRQQGVIQSKLLAGADFSVSTTPVAFQILG